MEQREEQCGRQQDEGKRGQAATSHEVCQPIRKVIGIRDKKEPKPTRRVENSNIAKIARHAYIAPAFSTSVTLQRLVPPRGRRLTDMPVGALMADINQLTRIIEPEARALGFD